MKRAIRFVPDAWDAYLYWQRQDKKTLKRVNMLLDAEARTPFRGIGNPEPLRGQLSGCWSRRIDDTHRFEKIRRSPGSLLEAFHEVDGLRLPHLGVDPEDLDGEPAFRIALREVPDALDQLLHLVSGAHRFELVHT